MYVVKQGSHFLYKTSNGSRSMTSDENRAEKYESLQKAKNVINSLPRNFPRKADCIVVALDNQGDETSNDFVEPYTEIDMSVLKQDVTNLSQQIALLKNNKDFLLNELSKCDRKISDIEHFIELNVFNACDGYKLAKMMKDILSKRRKVKNELKLIDILDTHSCKLIGNGSTLKAIEGLETQKYSPRELTALFAKS